MQLSSQLPSLAPRPRHEASSEPVGLTVQHSEDEWLAVYPHLERMYVRERRRLRYVMTEMQETYKFNATVQMYKKRFSKWGFYKNERRADSKREHNGDGAESCCKAMQRKAWVAPKTMQKARMVRSPKLSTSEYANLGFLTGVRTWTTAWFESGDLPGYPLSIDQLEESKLGPYRPKGTRSYDPEKSSFNFRVVSGLLAQGHGVLAGRLARKAFIQVEGILDLEGPLYVWNMLEILYSMTSRGQTQLSEMLIRHLMELARSRYPASHPVMQISYNLQKLVKSWQDSGPFHTAALEQAWTLNASILLDGFDLRLLLLYYRLIWDTALANLSTNKLLSIHKGLSELPVRLPAEDLIVDMAAAIHDDLEPDTSPNGTPAPENYDSIKEDAFAAIRELSTHDFSNVKIKISVLLALMKTKAFMQEFSSNPSRVPLFDARLLAHIIKTLSEVDLRMGADMDVAIERMRNVIALREYGQASFDPQLVSELWELEELLAEKGRLEEAEAIRATVDKMLEDFLGDVPANAV